MEHDSVTKWLRMLGRGDQDAARQLWNRYSAALIRLTQNCFPGSISAAADEEDLVQSVFQALWSGAKAGKFDGIKDRQELWWLLMAITRRKAVNRRAHDARREPHGKLRSLNAGDTVCDDSSATPHEWAVDDHPPPDLILMLQEEQQRLMSLLRDDRLRTIAACKLDGESHEDIARKLHITPRTVVRKLNLIRETWSKELES